LVFTTGEKKTQDAIGGTINYVPIEAVQTFNTATQEITNGIFAWANPLLKFNGKLEWVADKRRLEFDFFSLEVLGNDVTQSLPEFVRDAAGLSRDGLVMKRKPFFTFIACDGNVLVGRGGGGGVALWRAQ
jgi:hypothetical protein